MEADTNTLQTTVGGALTRPAAPFSDGGRDGHAP